jgi:hypothetical protein
MPVQPNPDNQPQPTQNRGKLPNSTPQNFALFLNLNFKGSDQKKGSPLTPLNSLGYTGASLGNQWLAFYADKIVTAPGHTLLEYETAFIVLVTEADLGIDLAAFVGGGGAAIGGVTQQAVTGVGQTTPVQLTQGILSVLQNGNLWLRIGEGILGIVLIAIGIAKLTNAVPAATKIAKTAGAVAVL